MPTLYFIRHGETDWNRAGRLQGQIDIPLNARGEAQARAAGRALLAREGAALAREAVGNLRFIASPLGRTRSTMELLRAELGLDPQDFALDDRLKEIHFGRWEGKTWDELRVEEPDQVQARERDRWNHVSPEGESYAMVRDRVMALIDGLDGDTCVVAHGGVARTILVSLTKMSRERALTSEIWQGKILHFARGEASWRPGPGHFDV